MANDEILVTTEEQIIEVNSVVGYADGKNELVTVKNNIDALQADVSALQEKDTFANVYSTKKGVADYYQWDTAPVENDDSNGIGLFVTLCQDSGKIKPCTGYSTDSDGNTARCEVFGVTVLDAAFIGGQDVETPRDGDYALVATAGMVCVRSTGEVAVGDYVVSDSNGFAKKAESGAYGYKVAALAETMATGADDDIVVPNVIIDLKVSANQLDLIGDHIRVLTDRLITAEANTAVAVSTANQALNSAAASEAKSDETQDTVYAEMDRVVDSIIADASGAANTVVEELRETAEQAQADAAGAVEKANEAFTMMEQLADDMETLESETDRKIAGIIVNGDEILSSVASIDKYSVGEYSQSYGLTNEQAQDILKEGMVYIPTEHINNTDDDIDGSHAEIFSDTGEINNFSPGFYYTWDGSDWIESGSAYVMFNGSAAPAGNEIYKYWYVDSNTAPEGYEPHALYMAEYNETEDKYEWKKVNILSGNANNRIVSMVRQTADEVAIEVTNARGSAASLSAKISDVEATAQMGAFWKNPESGVQNLAIVKASADETGSTLELGVMNASSDDPISTGIILTQKDGDPSKMQFSADSIDFEAGNYKISADNIVMDGTVTFVNKKDLTEYKDLFTLSPSNSSIPSDAEWVEDYPTNIGDNYIWKKTQVIKDGEVLKEYISCMTAKDGKDGLTPVKGVDYFDGTNGSDGTSIIWKGTWTEHPSNPQNGWAYYNSKDKKSYVCQEGGWFQMSVDGVNGQNGTDGVSIVWKGELATPPTNPQENWVYKDTDNGVVMIYHKTSETSGAWEPMVLDGSDGADGAAGKDGLSVFITYNDSEAPNTPTGDGTTDGWHTAATSNSIWMSQKVAKSATEGSWGVPIKIKGIDGKDGTSVTIQGSYETEAELKSAHPTGESGDSYMVGGDLYVWTGTSWQNVGQIKGDKGADGSPGTSAYVHVAWSMTLDNSDDSFSTEAFAGAIYMGTYADSTEADSEDFNAYKWVKVRGDDGKDGRGIRSTTTWYGVSNSSSTQPTDWKTSEKDVTVAEGQYLWTKTVTDYTDNTDTVSYSYAKQGKSGDSIQTRYLYYLSTSATAPGAPSVSTEGIISTTDWSFVSSGVSESKPYEYRSECTVTNGIYSQTCTAPALTSRYSKDGANGTGIKEVVEEYIAVATTSEPSNDDANWSKTIPAINETNKYLWNRERVIYTDDSSTISTKELIAEYGKNGGKGVQSVTDYYLVSGESSDITVNTTGWSTTKPSVTSELKYLWNYEKVVYIDNKTEHNTTPSIIGAYGDQGVSVSVKSIKYQVGDSATTAPTGTWEESIPAAPEGQYLWSKTTFSDESVAYGISKQGVSAPVKISSIVQYCCVGANETLPTDDEDARWKTEPKDFVKGDTVYTRLKETYDDDSVIYSEPVADQSFTTLSNWCYANDTTFINGANIATGSIEAKQIAANTITAEEIDTESLTIAMATINTIQSSDYRASGPIVIGSQDGTASEGLEYMLNDDEVSYSVTGIGTCTDLDIVIPSVYNGLPVTAIGEEATFYGTNVTSIVIPDSVTTIDTNAFESVFKLTTVTIGSGVTCIGEGAFRNCSSLVSVIISENSQLTKIDVSAFESCVSLTSITIPDSVMSIGDYAFYHCSSLTSVTFGKSVTTIGESAFSNCTSLINITIPDSVIFIDQDAFYGCSSLTTIEIPGSVAHIGEETLYNTGLTSIYYGGTADDWAAYRTILPDSATVYYGGEWEYAETQGFKISNSDVIIDSTNFKVTKGGNITANAGTIGGWEIGNDGIVKNKVANGTTENIVGMMSGSDDTYESLTNSDSESPVRFVAGTFQEYLQKTIQEEKTITFAGRTIGETATSTISLCGSEYVVQNIDGFTNSVTHTGAVASNTFTVTTSYNEGQYYIGSAQLGQILPSWVKASHITGVQYTPALGSNIAKVDFQYSQDGSVSCIMRSTSQNAKYEGKVTFSYSYEEMLDVDMIISGTNAIVSLIPKTNEVYSIDIKYTLRTAPPAFMVLEDGSLYASSAKIEGDCTFSGTICANDGTFNGEIFATGGTIGGWSIQRNQLGSADEGVMISPSGNIIANTITANSGIVTNNITGISDGSSTTQTVNVAIESSVVDEGEVGIFGLTSNGTVSIITTANVALVEPKSFDIRLYYTTGTTFDAVTKVDVTTVHIDAGASIGGTHVVHRFKSNNRIYTFNSCEFSNTSDSSFEQTTDDTKKDIYIKGNLLPSITSTSSGTGYNLGSTAYRWNTIYARNSTINTSDRNEKNSIKPLYSSYDQVFDALEPVSYKFNENNNNRTHIGLIAQDVKAAVESAGLTTQDFAAYCEWENKDGTIGCGLRYSEFIAMCIDQIQKLKARVAEQDEKIKDLEARLLALENK